MPVTMPAPGASSSYMPSAARAESLQEGAARVDQPLDALADRQLAALAVAGDGAFVAAGAALRQARSVRSRSSSTCPRMADALVAKASDAGSTAERRTAMWCGDYRRTAHVGARVRRG